MLSSRSRKDSSLYFHYDKPHNYKVIFSIRAAIVNIEVEAQLQ